MRPMVSVLVPVYNRVDLVGPCIESALSQTLTDLEVVVVDGASTDGTWEVCQRYASDDRRVHAIREDTNSGPVRGWWRCLEAAEGELGTFLWSDDLWQPTFLETTVPFLQDDRVALAYTAAEIGAAPGRGRVAYGLGVSGLITSESFIVGSLTTRGRYPLSPACGLFRVEDLKQNFVMELPTDPPVDLTRTGAGTDVLQFLLAATKRPLVAHRPEALAFFRAHPGSISIHGRGGEVDRSYCRAKSWFARGYGRPDLVPTIVAWQWIRDMRSSRTFINPASAARRYGEATGMSILWAAVRILARGVRARLGFRRRTSRPASNSAAPG